MRHGLRIVDNNHVQYGAIAVIVLHAHAWPGLAWLGVAVAWPGVALRWRVVSWLGVAWRGVACRYFTLMCLVSNVSDGKVFFDHAVGCDQVTERFWFCRFGIRVFSSVIFSCFFFLLRFVGRGAH